MLKVVVCIVIVVAVCCAQEHLTCLRTDNLLTQQSLQTPQRALQGSPGKRGPKGQAGSHGHPGQKGEPGIPDSSQINVLRDQIDLLSQKVETLQNQSRENQLEDQIILLIGEIQALKNQSRIKHQEEQITSLIQEVEAIKNQSRENGQFLDLISKLLYIPPYFYVYQLTPGVQSWHESRQYCRNWGGDLAVHGVKTMQNRQKLMENFSKGRYVWIGVNDIASEGNWMWVNGKRASSSDIIWASWEPNGGDDHDCVFMYLQEGSIDTGLAGDYNCSLKDPGLCEKRI